MKTQTAVRPRITSWLRMMAVAGIAAVLLAGPAGGADPLPAESAAEMSRAAELKKLTLEELMAVEVATVTTASKKAEKATDAPATVIVIDRREIKLRGYATLKDVLRDLPGMETIEFYFSEFGTQVPVRGISGNNKIVVLVNGMRVNPPGGENFPFRSDFSVRQAERIEVIYGPGSTLYGQDAISAVINVITKAPPDDTAVELGVLGGSNWEREAWGSFGGMLDKEHNIRLTGSIQYHDSELTPLDEEFKSYWQDYRDVALTKTNAHGRGVVPSREDYGLNLFARVEGFNSSVQVWYRESERSSSEGFNPILGFLPQARWGDSSLVAEARNSLPISEKIKLDSAVTYNRYEIDPRSRYVFPASESEWYLDDFKYGLGWNINVEETLRVDFNEKLSVLGGAMVSYADIIPKATFPSGGYYSNYQITHSGSFLYTTLDGVTNFIPRVSEVRYWTFAGYVEGGWKVLDQLKLIAGIRVTKDERFDDVPLTPRVAAIYNITDAWTAKYIYTRAYVAPAPYFAYATYDNGTLLATTNPELSPETADTHEVNFTYNKKNLTVGVSGYYGTQSDIIIVSDRAAPQNIITNVYLNGDTAAPRTLVQTANGGDSRRYGVDVYGRATFGPVSPWVSYSYVDFEEHNNGTETGPPGISRHNARAGATWAITSKLFVTPSLVIRSTPENVKPSPLDSALDTPWEINLYILYNATAHVDFFADLRNITNNKYALGGFTGDAIPQETFHGVVGVRFTF